MRSGTQAGQRSCSHIDPGAVEFRRLTFILIYLLISMASRSSTEQSNRRRIFFRAAAVAFNVQFFDAITEFLVFNSFSHVYLFYVTGLHDPLVLRTKMSRLSVWLYWRYHDVSLSRYQKFRQWYRVGLPQYF